MINVGIPRALLYYQFFPMWQTFFKELGAEVVVSPPTTKDMVAAGSSRVVSDTCLPVKVFLGHMLSLTGKCDYIFIPAIRSLKPRIYNCSKFLGLPDMTRAVIAGCPPILDTDIDLNKGKHQLYQAINKLGRHFTRDTARIRGARTAAWKAHLDYRQLMLKYGLTPPQAMQRLSSTPKAADPPGRTGLASNQTTIALIGHPYLLYDEHLNHRLIHRLEQAGNRVLTPETLTVEQLESSSAKLAGDTYWTFGEEVVGAGEHYLQNGVDGVIGILTFGCGPDSLMMDMVRRRAARLKATPFMSLVLEEHTAETGMITRLEAFMHQAKEFKKNGKRIEETE